MTPSLWLDRFFASYYDRRPVNASFIGVHDRDHRLPDFTENGAGDTVAEMEDLLGSSETLALRAASPAELLDLRLARGFLRTQLSEYRGEHFHRGNPSLYTGEAVFGVMALFLTEFAPLPERVAAAVARMEAIPAFLQNARTNVGQAPLDWTERGIRECTGALAFFTEGVGLLAGEKAIALPAFAAAAERAARAFASFRDHLDDMRQRPTDRYAAGDEALGLYLREGHFLTEPADEIARYAEAELAEARSTLEAHAADFGARTPEEAMAGLSLLHPSAETYYARYQELWNEARAVAEERGLVTWGKAPIRYVPRPGWARAAAPYLYFLFYRSPAAFNRPAVHDYLVTPIDPALPEAERQRLLEANNDSALKLNHVVHHGGIGHHLQNERAFQAASRIGQVAAVDCASRIALFCGGTMAEGWACYATDLMSEAGFLTPLERYAERHTRVRMCARAVVDVRLHQGRLTLDQAADYYRRHAGMPPDAARAEAVKNSMFPGAAVMYVMGTDAIHRLRRDLSARSGTRFDLRAFHDRFLSHGSVPVSLVAEAMRALSAC